MGSTAAYPTPLACGRLSFSLGIAGEHWEIRSTSPDLLLSVDDRTREFLEAEVSAKPEVSISSEWADTIPLLSDPVFDAGLWRAYKDSDRKIFDFASDVLGPSPYKRARFNHDMSYGHVLLNRECLDLELAWNPLEYPLDELLMMHRLALGRGAELHSCGVSVAGQGYLFAGHSGAGKSTTAKLWVENRRGTILSDDRIIIRRVGSSFEMHGTPWHGEAGLAQKSSVPLKAVFILEHGVRNEAVRLSGARAASELLSRSFLPYYEPEALSFTLEFLDRLVTNVPVSLLRFVPDAAILDLAEEVANGV